MISLGKKVNSLSGLADGIVNFLFRYLWDDTMKSMTTFSSSADIGKLWGYFFKQFFATEISAYQHDFYVVNTK